MAYQPAAIIPLTQKSAVIIQAVNKRRSFQHSRTRLTNAAIVSRHIPLKLVWFSSLGIQNELSQSDRKPSEKGAPPACRINESHCIRHADLFLHSFIRH